MCLNNSEDRVLRVDLTRSVSAVLNHQESAREYRDELVEVRSGVCTENLIRVDEAMESPKLAE